MSRPFDRYKRIPLIYPSGLLMGDVIAYQNRPRARRSYYIVLGQAAHVLFVADPYDKVYKATLSMSYMQDHLSHWSKVLVPPPSRSAIVRDTGRESV